MATTYTFTLANPATVMQDVRVTVGGILYDVDALYAAGPSQIVTTDPFLAEALTGLRVGTAALFSVNSVTAPLAPAPPPEYVVITNRSDYADGEIITWDAATAKWVPGATGATGPTGATGAQGPSGTVELAYAKMEATQTTTNTSTTPVDLPGLSLTFTVGTRPVYVMFEAIVFNATAGSRTAVSITDASNTVKMVRSVPSSAASSLALIRLQERIAAGTGTVTRKARFYAAPSGTANVFGDPASPAELFALEM